MPFAKMVARNFYFISPRQPANVHILSAVIHGEGLVVAQTRVDEISRLEPEEFHLPAEREKHEYRADACEIA